MECKECIFGNHKRKTCYLESSCEVMHEWLREHDKEIRNKAIDDVITHIDDICDEFRDRCNDYGCCSSCYKSGIKEIAEQLKS